MRQSAGIFVSLFFFGKASRRFFPLFLFCGMGFTRFFPMPPFRGKVSYGVFLLFLFFGKVSASLAGRRAFVWGKKMGETRLTTNLPRYSNFCGI